MRKNFKVIIMMETSRAYGRTILRGIAKYSHAQGPWVFYRRPPFYWGAGRAEVSLDWLRKVNADGMILREQRKRGLTERFLAMGLPTVVAAYRELFPDLINIVTDDRTIGRMAAEHLLHRGFKQFAYCGFGQMYCWSRQRGESFGDRIAEAGFEAHYCEYEPRPSSARRSWEKEQRIIADWVKLLPKPIGMLACNDDMSQHVIEACKIADLHVPEQVAIIGVGNDDLICELANPPLSSIVLSTEKAGYEAAAKLDKLMRGEQVTERTVVVRPNRVATRQSTNVFTVADHYVLDALRLIHAQAKKEPLQVDDVLRSVAISRRGLYDRFARTLGRSVHEEIKRVRVDEFARLLVSTGLPISQIASRLGCSDIKNLARYFKQAKGMSPLTYRKHHCLK
jgi:LacI family transcriptional regulator